MSKSKPTSSPGVQERIGHRKSSLSVIFKNNEVFLINLVCPDNSIMSKVHCVKETFCDIISDTCRNLRIELPELFGIAVYEHNEYRFISNKKSLQKVLPECLVVTHEQASQLNGIETRMLLDSTVKTSRLYLRMKHFYINIDNLPERTLHFCYEQVRLDTLKYQNWFSLQGYDDVLMDIAAKCLYLIYQGNAASKIAEDSGIIKRYLPLVKNTESKVAPLTELIKRIEDNMCQDAEADTDDDDEGDEVGPLNYERDSTRIINKNQGEVAASDAKLGVDTSASLSNVNNKNTENELDETYTKNAKAFRNDLMRIILKETLKLPFFGMYFYQVEMMQEGGVTLPNCRIGIGPLGINLYQSRDFTTWNEIECWGWRNIHAINFHKNILQINEKGNMQSGSKLFQCMDEFDAKYLFRHCREIHLFQTATLQEVKSRRGSRRESGVHRKGVSVASFFSHGRASLAGISPSRQGERRSSESYFKSPSGLNEVGEEAHSEDYE